MAVEESVMFHGWGRWAWQREAACLMAVGKQRESERSPRQDRLLDSMSLETYFVRQTPPDNISFHISSTLDESFNEVSTLVNESPWFPAWSQAWQHEPCKGILHILPHPPEGLCPFRSAKCIQSIPKSPQSLNCSNLSQKSKFKVTSKIRGKLLSCEPGWKSKRKRYAFIYSGGIE